MNEPSEEQPGPEASGAPDWLLTFFRDSSLWPVTFAAIAIFVVFGASGLLLAVVERNFFAVAAILIAFWIGVDIAVREWRQHGLGLATGLVVGFWTLSAAAAVTVRTLGWY
ncbi:MAG: hypothetical protein AAF430_05590 [Myxococcota bacterium]